MPWIEKINEQQSFDTPTNFPEPRVCFKNNFDEDSHSDASMATYLSACSSIFTNKGEEYDEPPATSDTPIQAWTSPPTILDPTISTAPSSITVNESEMAKKNETIRQLQSQVNQLTNQVQLLLANQQSLVDNPSSVTLQGDSTNSSITLNEQSLNLVIDTVIAKLKEAKDNGDVSTINASDIPDDINMSFESCGDFLEESNTRP